MGDVRICRAPKNEGDMSEVVGEGEALEGNDGGNVVDGIGEGFPASSVVRW